MSFIGSIVTKVAHRVMAHRQTNNGNEGESPQCECQQSENVQEQAVSQDPDDTESDHYANVTRDKCRSCSSSRRTSRSLKLEECQDTAEAALTNPECAVCLQPCIHPVRLPCTHIFCYLCVKGVANQSKRCALCRQEIPVDFLNNPSLLRQEDLLKDAQSEEEEYVWYYEGYNGWWKYDVRTSQELEEKYKQEVKSFESLIAGFLYVIDMDNMIQYRRNDPTRRRRIKRDKVDIPNKKGVAGLKVSSPLAPPERRQGDGGEPSVSTVPPTSSSNVHTSPSASTSVTSPPQVPTRFSHTRTAPSAINPDNNNGNPVNTPPAPTNTPQTPQTPVSGSPGLTASPVLSNDDLSSHIANLSLDDRHPLHIPRPRLDIFASHPHSQHTATSDTSSASENEWE